MTHAAPKLQSERGETRDRSPSFAPSMDPWHWREEASVCERSYVCIFVTRRRKGPPEDPFPTLLQTRLRDTETQRRRLGRCVGPEQ